MGEKQEDQAVNFHTQDELLHLWGRVPNEQGGLLIEASGRNKGEAQEPL